MLSKILMDSSEALSPSLSHLWNIYSMMPSAGPVLSQSLLSIHLKYSISTLSMSLYQTSSLSHLQWARSPEPWSEREAETTAAPEEALADSCVCMVGSQMSPEQNVLELCPAACVLEWGTRRPWTHQSKGTLSGEDPCLLLLAWWPLCADESIPLLFPRLCRLRWAQLGHHGSLFPATGSVAMAEAPYCTALSCSTGPQTHWSPCPWAESQVGILIPKHHHPHLEGSATPHDALCQL